MFESIRKLAAVVLREQGMEAGKTQSFIRKHGFFTAHSDLQLLPESSTFLAHITHSIFLTICGLEASVRATQISAMDTGQE